VQEDFLYSILDIGRNVMARVVRGMNCHEIELCK
jgi:hypothetical protein